MSELALLTFAVFLVFVAIALFSWSGDEKPSPKRPKPPEIPHIHMGTGYKSAMEEFWGLLSDRDKAEYRRDYGDPPDWCE